MRRKHIIISIVIVGLLGLFFLPLFTEGRGDIYSSKAIKAIEALIDSNGDVTIVTPAATLTPTQLTSIFSTLTDTKACIYDTATNRINCNSDITLGTNSVNMTHIDEANLGIQGSADCTLENVAALPELCRDTTGANINTIWAATATGTPGTWAQQACVTDYTNLIVDGDTTPGGLDTSNPTSTDYVCGTGITCVTTGTATAPIVTFNVDTNNTRVAYPFTRTGINANLTNLALEASANTADEFILPWAGTLVAIGCSVDSARTAGTVDVDISINGSVVVSDAILIDDNPTTRQANTSLSQAIAAGDYIEMNLDTSSDWAPTGNVMSCMVYVEYTS